MNAAHGANRIDALRAPLFVSWQLTRDCDLACLHCCTDSAPGRKVARELDANEAQRLAAEIIRADVPYVMLCGGEPLRVPHFLALAERLGKAGVQLKIETNGQMVDAALVERLARLPIRSIQISLDGDTEEVYRAQRPRGSLAKVHAACRAVRAAGMPLEVTFAPTRLNIDQIEAVIDRAVSFGAFRFNTGQLMRIGRAARLWRRIAPSAADYEKFQDALERRREDIEISRTPFTVADGLREALHSPSATLLVLPNGWVKVAAASPAICADLRQKSLLEAWDDYRDAWRNPAAIDPLRQAIADDSLHALANNWTALPLGG